MVASRHSQSTKGMAVQVRRVLLSPTSPLALASLVLSVLFGTSGVAAALALWSLYLIRASLRGDDEQHEQHASLIPEGLPQDTHWLVIDSPLGFVAGEQVCRMITPEEFRTTTIVLDLRGLSTLDGLPTALPQLLSAARCAGPRIIVLSSETLLSELLRERHVLQGCVFMQTAAGAVAQIRLWRFKLKPDDG